MLYSRLADIAEICSLHPHTNHTNQGMNDHALKRPVSLWHVFVTGVGHTSQMYQQLLRILQATYIIHVKRGWTGVANRHKP
jgi:hypothetical protein